MIQQPTCAVAARFGLLHPLLLLVAGLVAWPPDWDGVRAVVDCARSPEPGPAEREARAVSYYVELIEGSSGPEASGTARPGGWVGFREAEVIRYLDDDFLLFELKPEVHRTLFGQPFETNAYGMHDDAVAPEKPEGTFRIAVLGASMDMGWGVRYQDTYINRLQHWLTAHAARDAWPAAAVRGAQLRRRRLQPAPAARDAAAQGAGVPARPGDLLGHHARHPPDGDPPLRHAPQGGRPEIRLRPRGGRPGGHRSRRRRGSTATAC